MEGFKGRIALITGAGRGIGYAIAKRLAEEGAIIIINDIAIELAEKAAKELTNLGYQARASVADISQEEQISQMFESFFQEYGHIDILVNNAGISGVAPSVELSKKVYDKVMDVNITGVFLCCKFAARYMMKTGGGKILNMSSIAGYNGFPERASYGPAKAGVINLTKVLACEWAKWNINVNAIAPGYVLTDMVKDFIKRGLFDVEKLIERIPQKKMGSEDDIANAAVFLLSKEAAYITGVTLPVDGGWLAYGYI